MTVQTDHSTTVSRTVRATPEAVFEAWTQPHHLQRWSCPEGASIEDVQVDLRVDGTYRICMKGAEGEPYTAFGAYREIDPPRRLVYTWDWEEAAQAVGETLVSVTFEPTDDGTRVIVVHSGFPAAEAAKGHETGWTSCLDNLTALVATPLPD